MRCDNHYPIFDVETEAENKTVNHTVFEYLPALQTWSLALTPSPPLVFLSANQYTSIDYLF